MLYTCFVSQEKRVSAVGVSFKVLNPTLLHAGLGNTHKKSPWHCARGMNGGREVRQGESK